MMEEWKNIEGYEGIYQISNLGNVKSLTRISHGRKYEERILSTHLVNGYVVVTLAKNGKLKTPKVHRLVAKAFIPNPEQKPCVDHIDTDRTNNRVENLKWVTYQENTDNPLSSVQQKHSVSIARSVKVAQYSKDGNLINIFPSIAYAGKVTRTRATSINNNCKGRIKSANGFIWRYYKG